MVALLEGVRFLVSEVPLEGVRFLMSEVPLFSQGIVAVLASSHRVLMIDLLNHVTRFTPQRPRR